MKRETRETREEGDTEEYANKRMGRHGGPTGRQTKRWMAGWEIVEERNKKF